MKNNFVNCLSMMDRLHALTATYPKEVNRNVEKLLMLLDTDYEPEFVTVVPDIAAEIGFCYQNIEAKVKRDGGKAHYGWAIWQSDYLCEAEHHAVWETDNGDLIDITPQEDGFDKIMFVPYSKKVFTGKRINNIRINISGNPIVDHFIAALKTIDALAGLREWDPALGGYPIAPEADQYLQEFYKLAGILETYYLEGNKIGSKCYCGSVKKYSSCHGKNMLKSLEECTAEILKGKGS